MKTTTILNIVKEEISYNGEGSKAHEQSIADLLTSLGFTEISRVGLVTKEQKAELLVGNFDNFEMPAKTFVREPIGVRAPIDFLINAEEMFVLEAKSAKGLKIEWNDNPPKPYFYYILSITGHDNTVAKGSEWITTENFDKFYGISHTIADVFRMDIKKNPELTFDEVKDRLEIAFNSAKELMADSGFEYHPRRMCIQDKDHLKEIIE